MKRGDQIGFLIWNPNSNYPTYCHRSYAQAVRERDRLATQAPGERFVVMVPLSEDALKDRAQAWSDGKAEGLAQAHLEIMQAEAKTDILLEKVHAMEARLRQLEPFQHKSRKFQSIAADCLLWFDGFAAAYGGRDSWERPALPDRDTLRQLNAAFQKIIPADAADDDEIPF